MKENTKIFVEAYNPPMIVLNMFEKCIGSPEHPIFHPEKTLDAHIEIVMQRALEQDALELHFAAFLHDICKHGFCDFISTERQGTLKTIPEGDYWQNVKHPEHAVAFTNLPEVKSWIKSNGADFNVIEKLIKFHMRMKDYIAGENGEEGGMGDSKRIAFKIYFSDYEWDLMCYFSEYCDNMLLN
jgi:hypothetical protein